MMLMSKPNIHVAIALIFRNNQVLVGWRQANQHQGNKYEFPGGKVEQGEHPEQACRREVQEEVGIDIEDWHVFDCIKHEYDDVIVNLHLFHAMLPVQQLEQIQAPWTWYSRDVLPTLNFPKANQAIVQRLFWPKRIKCIQHIQPFTYADDILQLHTQEDFSVDELQNFQQLGTEQWASYILNIEILASLDASQKQQLAAWSLSQNQQLTLEKGDLLEGQCYLAYADNLHSALHAQNIGCDAVILQLDLTLNALNDMAKNLDIPVFIYGEFNADVLANLPYVYGFVD